jgi:hypothetical protein
LHSHEEAVLGFMAVAAFTEEGFMAVVSEELASDWASV